MPTTTLFEFHDMKTSRPEETKEMSLLIVNLKLHQLANLND